MSRSVNRLCCILTVSAAIASLPLYGHAFDGERWSSLKDTVFQHIVEDADLPNSAIPTAFGEDGDGFLWIGTQNGLARWDGYSFRSYKFNPNVSGTLPDNYITILHTDTQGRLWIGTSSGGLARFDREQERFITYPTGKHGLSHVAISSIVDDGVGGIWVATEGGLDHLDPKTGDIRHLRHDAKDPESLPSDHVRSLLRDSSGRLWVGTPSGLVRSDGGAEHFVAVPLPAPEGKVPEISALYEDSGKRIWIGSRRDGAFVIEQGETTAQRVLETGPGDSRLQTQQIETIAEARPGEIWLGTFGQGIVVVDSKTLQTRRIVHDPRVPSGLTDNTIWSLYRDRAGLIWVGTNRSLSRHDSQQTAVSTIFGVPGRANGLSDEDIHSVKSMPGGEIWLGLGSAGVDIVDSDAGSVSHLTSGISRSETALPKATVNAIADTGAGGVYIGTEQGLYRSDPLGQAVHRVHNGQCDPSAMIWTLLFEENVLWLGGPDGLCGLGLDANGANTAIHPKGADRLTDQRVTLIERGAPGKLWIGTGNGLNQLDVVSRADERIVSDRAHPDALTGGYISSIVTDRQGRVWVGTAGGGISILMGRDSGGRRSFRHLGVAEGLPNDDIAKMLEDREGNIWVSTDNGIAAINPKDFTIRSLNRADGVAISNYWVNSGDVTREGELVFGGIGGLTVIRPELLKAWTNHPPVVITEVRVNGKEVPSSRFNGSGSKVPLRLGAEDNSIAVEFAALEYSAPERCRYAYWLEGYDKSWIDTDAAHRLAAYTNLPPGNYKLRLRGSNRDGVWSETILTLPIHVLPAWYQTIWFRLIEALAAIALVAALVHVRTRQLRHYQRKLEQSVAERTAELQESQRQLERIAYLDFLTGLPNRRMFTDDFRRLMARMRRQEGRFVLLLIDLDDFKHVNDTLGHDAGDALLVEVASRLRTVVRESDSVARVGGDEFAILLPDDHEPPAIDLVCQRILDSFLAAISFKDANVAVSLSIGVAVYPEHGETQDSLYKSADLALYEAKRMGRNTSRWRHAEVVFQIEGDETAS